MKRTQCQRRNQPPSRHNNMRNKMYHADTTGQQKQIHAYRTPSAHKLEQLSCKYQFFQKAKVCIDLCATPSGWLDVAKANMPTKSKIIGVDIRVIRPIADCICLLQNARTEACQMALDYELQAKKVDVILYDGDNSFQKISAYQRICLMLNALKLCILYLRSGGWFITKMNYANEHFDALFWLLKKLFKKCIFSKLTATPITTEIYAVCKNYLGPKCISAHLLVPSYIFNELTIELQSNKQLLLAEETQVTAVNTPEMVTLNVSSLLQGDIKWRVLQGIDCIIIDDERVAQHPETTVDICEYCTNLSKLKRKNVRELVAWCKILKKDLFMQQPVKPEQSKKHQMVEAKKVLTQQDIVNMQDEELEEHLTDLTNAEQKQKLRKTKKIKYKSKLRQIQLHMNNWTNQLTSSVADVVNDVGPLEKTEEALFNLSSIRDIDASHIDDILDVAPDFDIDVLFVPEKFRKLKIKNKT